MEVAIQSILCILISLNLVVAVPLKLEGSHEERVFYNVKGSIKLSCHLDEPAANEIEWYKNETNVKEASELQERFAIKTNPENKESTLSITKAHNNDAGPYSCRLRDQRHDYETVANVAVKLPSNSGVVEGEKLKMHCASVGTDIKIRWILPDNTTISENGELTDKRIKLNDENGIKNSQLIINEVRQSDAGVYKCEGRSEWSANSVEAETIVRVKDKFAALWPFIGICSEVFILCVIILIYEKRRTKNVDLDESDTDVGNEKSDNNKDVRQRK